jgi:hypothetical protein
MRLQQEANQKIAELAERAHTEAIASVHFIDNLGLLTWCSMD